MLHSATRRIIIVSLIIAACMTSYRQIIPEADEVNKAPQPPKSLIASIPSISSITYADYFIEHKNPKYPFEPVRTLLDNKPLLCDTPSRIESNRILVPAEPILKKMGINILWDDDMQTAYIKSGVLNIVIRPGDNTASVNQVLYKLDIAPKLVEGELMLPISLVRVLGVMASWDNDSRVVSLRTGKETSANNTPSTGRETPTEQSGPNSETPCTVSILMYHVIGDGPSTLFVREREFPLHMKYLYENNYQVISLERALKVLKGEEYIEKAVVITFDDGYASFYDKAWDVLKKYGFTATVFAITDLCNNERYLSWEQMRFLEANWIDVGSHTLSHAALKNADENELEREIAGSKRIIEENLIYPCSFFCYPEGYYSDAAIEAVKKAGYASAVTIMSGNASAKSNLYKLPRLYVRRGVTPERLAKIMVTGKT